MLDPLGQDSNFCLRQGIQPSKCLAVHPTALQKAGWHKHFGNRAYCGLSGLDAILSTSASKLEDQSCSEEGLVTEFLKLKF